uniref:AMP-dependent synthetase/ligase domain-containing protein n=1 Tax=Chromera velia CCMP2878 TaxID=1169474 RepID=A0A0G4H663_9ALVE|eukprot:Cvel_24841.t1-p1 / transcript=Cvel_24841.t1 / gene=Cvel_24841 / organism=Chromera_velia_CCMP2878 / gene_product=Long-chain-fatty-acid--CoA ligase 1, putative / transcript_product=Long-chain-fatty-acid--CoA ligase 1, putative / location=Cvel_scaffold2740:20815-22089(-) / protein_length=425 / sequence_SO=supercontig / SO=protein_coding / is_pseudo=false
MASDSAKGASRTHVRVHEWASLLRQAEALGLSEEGRAGPQKVLLASERGGIFPQLSSDSVSVEDDKLFALMMTSGSTGSPKAAMFTDRMWTVDTGHAMYMPNYRNVSFIPLSHSSDLMRTFETLLNGGCTGFARYDSTGTAVEDLIEDVGMLRPAMIVAPPRVWNCLYEKFQRRLREGEGREKEIERLNEDFRNMMGGRLQVVCTGGAPTAQRVMEWLEGTFSCGVLESYGATECGAIATNGVVEAGVQVQLRALSEGRGGAVTDSSVAPPSFGEVMVKSPNLFAGYLDLPALTRECFDAEGWYATGDLGRLDSEGHLSCVGRVKHTFKLSSGEYYYPDELEKLYEGAEGVNAVCIHGEPCEATVIAICVVNTNCGLSDHEILKAFQKRGKEADKKSFEIPGGVICERHMERTMENGMLTMSLKI